jgi:hypothetical protein
MTTFREITKKVALGNFEEYVCNLVCLIYYHSTDKCINIMVLKAITFISSIVTFFIDWSGFAGFGIQLSMMNGKNSD